MKFNLQRLLIILMSVMTLIGCDSKRSETAFEIFGWLIFGLAGWMVYKHYTKGKNSGTEDEE